MATRRQFLQIGSAAGAGLFLYYRNGLPRVFAAPIPGGTLDPSAVPQYATPLLVPPVMPKAGTILLEGGKNADYYEISMRQLTQQILPAGLPATTVWGYGAVKSASKNGLLIHNAPSLTIEAQVESARAREVDQRPGGCERQLPPAPAARSTRRSTGPTRRAAWPAVIRGRPSRSTPRPLHRPRPDGHARPRRRRRRRRERRLRRGVVPARGERPPGGLRRPRAPGTTSSRARPRRASARLGAPASPPSSTRTSTAPRPSGTTTTRSA